MEENEIVDTPEEEIIDTPEEDIPEDSGEEAPEEASEEEEKPIDVEAIKVEIRERDAEEKIEYGDDIDEDDVKTIGSIVEKQTAGVKAQLRQAQDKAEIDSFIQERPQFAKYRPVIEKYIKESPEVYGKIPIKNIAAMVASDDLMKLGAKAEREAQAKADATKTKGSAVRQPQGGQKDWTKVSKEEFEAHKRSVLQNH